MALTIDGDWVRELRQANGWTLRAFAQVTELSPGYLSKIENGQRTASPDAMWQIADAFGVPLAAITGNPAAFHRALNAAMRNPKARQGKRAAKAVA